jgi:hypothetical protein
MSVELKVVDLDFERVCKSVALMAVEKVETMVAYSENEMVFSKAVSSVAW